MLNEAEISRNCFDLPMRLELIVHPGTMCADLDAPADIVKEELLEALYDLAAREKLDAGKFPKLNRVLTDPDYDPDELEPDVIDLLRVYGGYWVKAATPFMTWSSHSCGHYSWGHYYTDWMHGNTIDEAVQAALAWADYMHKKDRPEAVDGEVAG